MKKIIQVAGKGISLRGNDIDTDRIIPARFLRTITFEGLGKYAFQDARFTQTGEKKKHPFNEPKNSGAKVLVVNKNFGCGSSREHAPQSLMRWGIEAIIGESFAEIFAGNCQMLGIPCVIAGEEQVQTLQDFLEEDENPMLTIDLEQGKAFFADTSINVKVPGNRRKILLEGTWDTLGVLASNPKEVMEKAETLPYIAAFQQPKN